MQKLFVLAVAAIVVFVWLTSGALPEVVASHFGPGGRADGSMGRGTYTALMIGLVILAPGLVAATTLLVRLLPPQLVNLPNKRYWLAPELRAASLAALGGLGTRFALALALFLGWVHWLVVRANAVQPPRLSETGLFAGLAVFGVATLVWIVALFRRFGRVPDDARGRR
jgi:serine/threonine-protein kinase